MSFLSPRLSGLSRLRLPAALLAGLLQRGPVVGWVAEAADSVLDSPAVMLLKAAAAAAAALGAVDSVAGATTYTLTTGSPGHPSPYAVSEGSQITGVAFALASVPQTASPPESWTIAGQIPPGLEFGVNGGYITAPGFVNASNPTLIGTPTQAGTYTMVLTAWEFTAGTGLSSTPFTYQVVVNSGPTPTPTPTPTPAGNPPVFTTQPLSVAVTGGTVALDAAASNSPSYQWMLNGSPVSGATDATLVISDASSAAGTYTCVASNASGSATSAPATVTVVNTASVGHMVNISARSQVGTGPNIIFGGFAVGPLNTPGSLNVLVRASGPALVPFGVPGTLPDPQLQLFDSGGNLKATNEGWGGDALVASEAAAVGAFSWGNPASHDAAFALSVPTQTFTAQVAGQSGDTGVALMEVYAASPGFTAGMPHLVNLSARVFVGAGSNAMFAGFVIQGSTALTVLIRASGPALAAFGVGGTLPDPQLSLEYQATGAVIASNSSWGGDSQIAAAAASVGAFAWGDPNSHDSALLITLPPGNYTAYVSGASGDTGDAIAEVYEIQ
jgi:hypothetical protein